VITVEELCLRMANDAHYVPHVPIDEYRAYVFGLIGNDRPSLRPCPPIDGS
jgi:hypothetical protein